MTQDINLSRSDMDDFFIHHLNRIYSAKMNLLERLPEILYEVQFKDLEEAIYETMQVVQSQKIRMEKIYSIMDAAISETNVNGLDALIDESFDDIKKHRDNPELRDMTIMFYMVNIESIEMASFQVLQLLSVKLGSEVIKSLIKDNFDDAKSDRALLLLITSKYLSTV